MSAHLTRAELEDEATACQARIDAAYWAFSRTKRGKPPILVVPDAYQRLREIKALLPLVSPCGAVHVASERNRLFHTFRLSCNCTIYAFGDGTAFMSSRRDCRDNSDSDADCDSRARSAFAWFSESRGVGHPALFQEAG